MTMTAAEHLTRNLGLWITNDEGCYERYSERARELYDSEIEDDETPAEAKRIATLKLADEIESDHEDMLTDASDYHKEIDGWLLDLLTVALAHIDWGDLAEYYTADMSDD